MDAGRFGCYLTGGVPVGGRLGYPGCRDPAPPLASAALRLPGSAAMRAYLGYLRMAQVG